MKRSLTLALLVGFAALASACQSTNPNVSTQKHRKTTSGNGKCQATKQGNFMMR